MSHKKHKKKGSFSGELNVSFRKKHWHVTGYFKGFIIFLALILCGFIFYTNIKPFKKVPVVPQIEKVLYVGPVYHIFFHSLVVYPELAFVGDAESKSRRDYMLTQTEFKKILNELYVNDFVLIDIHTLYAARPDGTVIKKDVYVPKGKKPLVLSLDDISYYRKQTGHGLAEKLVVKGGRVMTQVVTPVGKTIVTDDGDVIPIVDSFVAEYPDFSSDGTKGLIALTGFDGILGYRTNSEVAIATPLTYKIEIEGAKKVVKKLKETGWTFGSHSYTHERAFTSGAISLEEVKRDTELWDKEVRPLVGDTDVFVGPFGQIFGVGDARRNYLISRGFRMFAGVGMETYLHFFPDQVVMSRADIDGIRLFQTPKLLLPYFDPKKVILQI